MVSTNYIRRDNYETAAPQDRFIVSLLKYHIHYALTVFGRPTKLHAQALDVGCGSQPFRKDLELLNYSYLSLDAEQNPESTVDIVCSIDQPLLLETLKGEKFDFVLCTEVMEHVADWQGAFENFSRLLKPGGRLLITCPYIYPLHEEPYDYWRPTPFAFQYFADKYNLKIIHQVNAGDAWDVLGTVLAHFNTEPVSRRFTDRIINKLISKGKGFLLKLLLKGYLQKFSQAKGKLYQANVVVFEK